MHFSEFVITCKCTLNLKTTDVLLYSDCKRKFILKFFLYPALSGYFILLYIYKDFGMTWCLCLHRGRPELGLDAPDP